MSKIVRSDAVPRRHRRCSRRPSEFGASPGAAQASGNAKNRTPIAQELLALCGTASKFLNLFQRAHRQIIHSRHTCLSLPSPCAPFIPLVSDTFEATRTRSLVIILAHTIMFQVLTGVCSSRAHRQWSIHFKSANAHGRALRDTAAHRGRAACAARRVGSSAEARKPAAFTYSTMLPRCVLLPKAVFGAVFDVLVACERQLRQPAAHAGRG